MHAFSIFQLENQQDDWSHHVFLSDVRDNKFDPVLSAANKSRMANCVSLKKYFLLFFNWFFIAGDKHIVIDTFIEVKIPQGLLVCRLCLYHLFHFLYVELANSIQVLVDLAYDHLLLPSQSNTLSNTSGKSELYCLRKILRNYM